MTTSEVRPLLEYHPGVKAIVESEPVVTAVSEHERRNRIKQIFSGAVIAAGACAFVGSVLSGTFISIQESGLQVGGTVVSVIIIGLGTMGLFRFGVSSPSINDFANTLSTMRTLTLGHFYAKQESSNQNLFTVDQLEKYRVISEACASQMRNLLSRYAAWAKKSQHSGSVELIQQAETLKPLEDEWVSIKNSIFGLEP